MWLILVLFIAFMLLVLAGGFLRKIAIAGFVLIVACVLGLVFWIYQHDARADQERELAKTYIKTNEIAIIDPRVSFDATDGHPNRIMGRVRNNSGYTMEKFAMRLTFQDCVTSGHCETVGDEEKEIRVGVPPGQSRDFDDYLTGPIMKPKGKIEWAFQVVSTSTQAY